MSEVLLINPLMWSPSGHETFNAVSPPLGLAYLAASLLQERVSVRILDLSVSTNPQGELEAAFARQAPLLVGITSHTQNYFRALEVARTVRGLNGKAFIAMGGPHVSYLWQEALAEPALNAVVFFEGEQTLVELYRWIQGGASDLSGIAGIAYRQEGRAVATPPRPMEENLDRVPYPARHLLPMARYARPGTIMTSRGCTQKCIFCISSTYEGKYRPRSAHNVVEELAILRHTWGLSEIYFLDNVFTVDHERVRSVCRQIMDNKLDIRFHCVSRADLMTEELAGWLKAAGCQRIEIGVESGSQEIIDALRKHITLEHVLRAARLVLRAGLQPMFTFQIGSPYDTPATLQQTLDLAAYLRAQGAITLLSVMTPYPGTLLAANAKKLRVKIRASGWREYRTSNPICDTRYLDRNTLRKALYQEMARQYAPNVRSWEGKSD